MDLITGAFNHHKWVLWVLERLRPRDGILLCHLSVWENVSASSRAFVRLASEKRMPRSWQFEAWDSFFTRSYRAWADGGGAIGLELQIPQIIFIFKDWFDKWYVGLDFQIIAGLLRKNARSAHFFDHYWTLQALFLLAFDDAAISLKLSFGNSEWDSQASGSLT